MNIGILKEAKEETRVSVTPDIVDALKKSGQPSLLKKAPENNPIITTRIIKRPEQTSYLVKTLSANLIL